MYDKVGNICEIDFSVPVLKMAIDVLFRHLRNSLLCLNQTLLVHVIVKLKNIPNNIIFKSEETG